MQIIIDFMTYSMPISAFRSRGWLLSVRLRGVQKGGLSVSFGSLPAKGGSEREAKLRAFAAGGCGPPAPTSRICKEKEPSSLRRVRLLAVRLMDCDRRGAILRDRFPLPAGAVAPKARAGKGTKPEASVLCGPPFRHAGSGDTDAKRALSGRRGPAGNGNAEWLAEESTLTKRQVGSVRARRRCAPARCRATP